MIIRGDAGLGKSALLADAVERARGMRVLRAAGAESDAELPFSGLRESCAPLVDDLGVLPVEQATRVASALELRGRTIAGDRFRRGPGAARPAATRRREEGGYPGELVRDPTARDEVRQGRFGSEEQRLGAGAAGEDAAAELAARGLPPGGFFRLRVTGGVCFPENAAAESASSSGKAPKEVPSRRRAEASVRRSSSDATRRSSR